MKQAILLHGTGGDDKDYFWFEDTKQHLESLGYEVWWPQLPNAERPELDESLRLLQEFMPVLDKESVIVGHSSACPLILQLLGTLDSTIGQAVLVSGFYSPITEESKLALPKNGFNWKAIREHAEEIIFINSDNDPWGCTADKAMEAAKALDAPMIINHGEGHMGSGSYDQPYREFPLLKRLLV